MKRILLIITVMVMGCDQSPRSKIDLNLDDGIFTSDKINTDLDIGSISYKQITDPNGTSSIEILVESYKVTEAKNALKREELREKNIEKVIDIANAVIMAGSI